MFIVCVCVHVRETHTERESREGPTVPSISSPSIQHSQQPKGKGHIVYTVILRRSYLMTYSACDSGVRILKQISSPAGNDIEKAASAGLLYRPRTNKVHNNSCETVPPKRDIVILGLRRGGGDFRFRVLSVLPCVWVFSRRKISADATDRQTVLDPTNGKMVLSVRGRVGWMAEW